MLKCKVSIDMERLGGNPRKEIQRGAFVISVLISATLDHAYARQTQETG